MNAQFSPTAETMPFLITGSLPGDANAPRLTAEMTRYADPLALDAARDTTISLSDRHLSRLLLLTGEIGRRFERERRDTEPAAWMYAPRVLFGGRNAVEACSQRGRFLDAMLLHKVTPLLDMHPEDMATLVYPDDEANVPECGSTASFVSPSEPADVPALFCASIVEEDAKGTRHIFYATLAPTDDHMYLELRGRFGIRLADLALVEKGFDPSKPVAASLLSEAMSAILEDVAQNPESALAEGLEVCLEQRFAS